MVSQKAPISGVRNQLNKIYQVLINDEELLRLLYYKNDPLSPQHENIIGHEKYWDIVEEHIHLKEKDSELTDDALCRVILTKGRRRREFWNSFVMRQHFTINTIVHEDFDPEMRLEQISDRVNTLLLHKRISGFGKIIYEGGDPYQAPRQFQTYLDIYSFLVKSRVTK